VATAIFCNLLFHILLLGSSRSSSPIKDEDLLDGATLLKEKLEFLGEGMGEVSAVQLMAIQLEVKFRFVNF